MANPKDLWRTYTQSDYDADLLSSGENPQFNVGSRVRTNRVIQRDGKLYNVMDDGTLREAARTDDNFWNNYGPLLAGGALAGVVAPAVMAGAGAAAAGGAEAGLAAGAAEGLAGAGAGELGAGALASDAGFLPGSFELGASGYGGTASQGLLTAGAEAGNAWGGISNALTNSPPGSGSALQRMFGLDQGTSDLLDVGGKVGGTFLGLLGSNAQGDAYNQMAQQYLALGANDRARLDASYAPGFNIWDQPGYKGLLKGVTDTQLRRLSTEGNPYGNPGGLAEMNKNITQNVGLPALAGYRGQLLQGGGVGLNAAAQGSLMEAGTARSPYDALAAGLGSLTAPKDNSLEELLRRYNQQQPITLNRSGVT